MSITLDGLDFELADFTGTDGLGHTETQAGTTGTSGATYPAEPLFPERLFRAALNQLGLGLFTTSNSSVSIGTGSKSFTLASSVGIQVGAWVTITSTASSANYMFGQVTGIVGLVYTVNVTTTGGSGTIASWNFQVSGVQGVAGSYTNEEAQDAVGSILTDTATIDFTYDDSTPQITASVKSSSITEAMQVLADNTTNDVSTTKHGYAPKAPNDTTKFLRGDATWAVPTDENFSIKLNYSSGWKMPATARGDVASTGLSYTLGELRAVPILIGETQTFTRIGIYCKTSSATRNVRLGIYTDSSGAPGALVLDAGAVSVASTGAKEITISQSLSAGWYWLVYEQDNATPQIASWAATEFLPLMGNDDSRGDSPIGYAYVAHTYGSLPASFGTASWRVATSPCISLRV